MKIFIYTVLLSLLWVFLIKAQTSYLTSSNLPIIIINTHHQDIIDQVRIKVDMGIINNQQQRNNIDDPFNEYNGKIAIETRGSSSSAYPKKQYRFETQDSAGNNLNISLLGLPQENDWILYGPYDDQSLIRNVLAYKISNDMGRYASRTRFCELIVNDEYQGLYVLLETIKRDNNRVDIATLNPQDIEGDQLTGGYIVKVDKIEGESTEHWYSPFGTRYQYHYPKYDDIQPQQIDYIQNYMASFESIMNSSGFNDPVNGYSQFIDVGSFVDHFIINEFCKNVDAFRLSAFLYKDKDSNDSRLHAGPVWDFNLSFGKAWFIEDLYRTAGWQVFYNSWRPGDIYKVPFWWEKLARDYHFEQQLVKRWQLLRQNILATENIFNVIDSLSAKISEARQRNFERWPQPAADHSYEFEILQLKSWISARTEWIDSNLDLLTSLASKNLKPTPTIFELSQNYPNPFNAKTMIEYTVGAYRNTPALVELSIYNLLGQKVTTLVNTKQAPGKYSVEWDTGGMASGVYLYKLSTETYTQTKKMILVK